MSITSKLFAAIEAASALNLFKATSEEELSQFLFLLDDDPTIPEESIRLYLEESSEREELRQGFEDFLKDYSSK